MKENQPVKGESVTDIPEGELRADTNKVAIVTPAAMKLESIISGTIIIADIIIIMVSEHYIINCIFEQTL